MHWSTAPATSLALAPLVEDRGARRLVAEHGLGETDELLLTGGSAGGLATILNVDRVQRIVGAGVRVAGLSNAGFFKPVANHTAHRSGSLYCYPAFSNYW